MCDIEFTIEQGKLWMLQTRGQAHLATAALRIAIEMVEEGLITREEAGIDPGRSSTNSAPAVRRLQEVRGPGQRSGTPAPVPPWARSCFERRRCRAFRRGSQGHSGSLGD